MRRRKRNSHLVKRPTQRVTFTMLGWLLIAMISAVVAVFLVVGSVFHLTVDTFQTYPGWIRPRHSAIPVRLPAGFVLREIVAAEGDQIDAGQTLAVLDQEQMEGQLATFQANLAAVVTLRQCLMTTKRDVEMQREYPAPSGDGAVARALRECWHFKTSFDHQRELLQAELELLTEQRDLLRKRTKLSAISHTEADVFALQDLIATSFAGTKIDEEILAKKTALDELELEYEANTIERLQGLDVQIEGLKEQIRATHRAIDLPRITAEGAGILRRLRQVQPGFVTQEEVVLAQIQPSQEDGFAVAFHVPFEQADRFFVGIPVQLSLLGWRGKSMSLTGSVIGFLSPQTQSPEFLEVEVALSPESRELLSAALDRLALSDRKTASRVTVRIAGHKIGNSLYRVASNNVGDRALARVWAQFTADERVR